jgi:hypothetical protein
LCTSSSPWKSNNDSTEVLGGKEKKAERMPDTIGTNAGSRNPQ